MGNRLSKEVDYESAGRPLESRLARQVEFEMDSNLTLLVSIRQEVGRHYRELASPRFSINKVSLCDLGVSKESCS